MNEIASLCERVGADVNDVMRALGRDGRIGPKFLHPGPGYGGSCLPKDTKALAAAARKVGRPLTIVDALIGANDRHKVSMVSKVEEATGGLGGKTVAVLGLAFKPNTDDIRESPSLTIVRGMVSKGARVRAFDPVLQSERRDVSLPIFGITYSTGRTSMKRQQEQTLSSFSRNGINFGISICRD